MADYKMPYGSHEYINFAEDCIDQTGNFEDSTFPSKEKKVRHRKKHLFRKICAQMEFYFSDANLTKDRFLSKLLSESEEIDVSVFLRFNKIRALTTNPVDIAKAVRLSDILGVTEDNQKIFRTTPVSVKDNVDDCTIYVERIPSDVDHDWVKNIFSAYGKVVYVSLPRFKQSLTNKGFAFVEYDTPKEAENALKAFDSVNCYLADAEPEELYSIKTFEGNEQKPGSVISTENTDIEDSKINSKHLEMENKSKENIEDIAVSTETLNDRGEDLDENEEKIGRKKSMEKKVKLVTDDEGNKSDKEKPLKDENDLEENTGKTETQLINDENIEQGQKHSKKASKKSKSKHESSSTNIEEFDEESLSEEKLSIEPEEANVIVKQHSKKEKVKRKHTETVLEETNAQDTPCKRKKISKGEKDSYLQNEPILTLDYKSNEQNKQDISSNVLVKEEQDSTCLNSEVNQNELNEQQKIYTATVVNTGTNNMGEVYLIDNGTGDQKKRRRRSKKKKKKHYEEENEIELKVLSKRDWKRLRNKYLNIQRESMKKLKHQVQTKNRIFSECLKQYSNKKFMLQRSTQNKFDTKDAVLRLKSDPGLKHTQVLTNQLVNGSSVVSDQTVNGSSDEANNSNSTTEIDTNDPVSVVNESVNGTINKDSSTKNIDDETIFKRPFDVPRKSMNVVSHSAKGPKFKPKVIVHIILDNPVDPRMFKEEAKSYYGVKYVDIDNWGTEAYLRCANWQVATQLIDERHWNNMRLLSGQEEQDYWNKIMSDRKTKFEKTAGEKLNGRKKLIKKAEKALGKHIRFDD